MLKRRFQQQRRLLTQGAIAALMGSSFAAMNGKLSLINSALAATGRYADIDDYKALVCVFLYGGSDSFNMFVPLEQGAFDDYTAARGSLSLPRSEFLADQTNEIGFNANLGALRDLYDSGRLALVGNVGNLVRPISRSEIQAGNAQLPVDLFAHDHQQEQVQKAIASLPQSVVEAGWGGRMADLLAEANAGSILPPTFSLFGTNSFQTGQDTLPIAINPTSGPTHLSYLSTAVGGTDNIARAATLQKVMALPTSGPLQSFANSSFQRAHDSNTLLAQVLENSPAFTTPYDPANYLSAQLRMVARLIAARSELNLKRQIFFVGMSGWDTHDDQHPRLQALNAELNEGLASFQQTLDEMPEIANQVTTFTQSDFGRSLTNNGGGSNHGWGGHYLVMGGAVNGGQLVGNWPDYNIGGIDDFNDGGRIIPQISINEFGAALGSWMGLRDSDLLDVFPDLGNFGSAWQNQFGLFNNA